MGNEDNLVKLENLGKLANLVQKVPEEEMDLKVQWAKPVHLVYKVSLV